MFCSACRTARCATICSCTAMAMPRCAHTHDTQLRLTQLLPPARTRPCLAVVSTWAELRQLPVVQTVAAVEALRREADEAADASDDTVTSKTVLPPTGDKRTYYSLDTYAWPSNGNHTDLDTPWISRDGYPFAKVCRGSFVCSRRIHTTFWVLGGGGCGVCSGSRSRRTRSCSSSSSRA